VAAKNLRRSFWLATTCGGVGLLVIGFYWSPFIGPAILGKVASTSAGNAAYTLFRRVVSKTAVTWENRSNDWLVRDGKKAPVSDQLICLGIDDASTSLDELDLADFATKMDPASSDYRALESITKGWPWSREVHALALEKLMQAGAKVVVFDVVFGKQTPDDDVLARSLEAHRGRVVVGSNFTPVLQPNGTQGSVQTMPNGSLIPLSTPADNRIGFVNFWPDPVDGRVRGATFHITLHSLNGYRYHPSQEIFSSLAAQTLRKAGLGYKVPEDREEYLIHFADPRSEVLRPKAFYHLFVPSYWKNNFQDGAILKDKIVMIGPYATIMHDVAATPFGELPGPHLHLQAINAAINNAFLTRLPLWAGTLWIAAAALLAWVITRFLQGPLLQFLSLVGGSGVFLGASWVSYNSFLTYPVTVAPLLALNGAGILAMVYQFVVEKLERARTRRTLERYVSRNLVSELLDNPEEFMGVKRTPVTVLFSDLRGFTSMTENSDAHVLVVQLNEYLTEMVKCVFTHQGTLDKFIGDAVMAVWGNVKSHGAAEDARRAVAAALDMRIALRELNARWLAAGLQEFRFGIGLNHGEVIRGDIGSPEKSEFTVIGDPINLASRMEGLTKNYGTDILIGEDVAELVRDHFVLQSIDRVRVKGKGEPTEVFAVHQTSSQPISAELADHLDCFGDALQLYRNAQFSEAEKRLARLLCARPGDPMCLLYLERCREFLQHPPGEDWDGVFTMKTK
jgi:adenylate cyclase